MIWFLLIIIGVSAGVLVTNGIAMVLAVVGLLPRVIGKSQTQDRVMLYENMIIAGTVFGGTSSVIKEVSRGIRWLFTSVSDSIIREILENAGLIIFGLFAGMFVGCLALAIAEMLNSIPILARRIGFRHGIGLAVTSMAFGKLVGSLLYFLNEALQSPCL